MSTVRVEHRAEEHRFVARVEGGEAFLSYQPVDAQTLDLQHTVVPEEDRGEGVGDALVRAAVDHARAQGQRIVPTCPFVASWLRAHPEAASVVASA